MTQRPAIKRGRPARVIAGKYAGAVGEVEEIREDSGRVKLHISGIVQGVPVQGAKWLKVEQVEGA